MAYKTDVELAIKRLFPSRWTKEDIKYFLKEYRYDLDVSSLNLNLNEPIRDFVLRGGKRLRPMMFLLCLQVFKKDSQKYVDIAAMIELVHNGTLILDDIEDDGRLRRGKPTCHLAYGLDTATNTGMALHVLPLRVITRHKYLTEKQKLDLLNIYTDEVINVSFGQALDIHWHKNQTLQVDFNKYLEMVRLKTGSLMRMSLRMAAAIAEQKKSTRIILKEYAESVGMAFQIKDDVLDLQTTDEKFGKSHGNDITEGKMSLPVVYALKNTSSNEKKELTYILQKHTRDKRQIDRAIEIISKSGAIDQAEHFAEELVDEGWKRIERYVEDGEALQKFKELTYYLIKRTY